MHPAPPPLPRPSRTIGRSLAPALLLVAACGIDADPAPGPAAPAAPTSLLLVTIDTLRADRMGAYGNPRDTTPVFDALAAQGALFERVYAQRGSTWPSLMSIVSSQHPVTHGVRHNGQPLSGDPPTLAHVLSASGYRCGAVLTNASELGWQGFDDLVPVLQEPRDVLATDRAIGWLDEHGDEPFFLWVHYVAPHDPFQPSDEHRGYLDPAYEGPVDGSVSSNTRLLFGQGPVPTADRDQLLALYDGELSWSDAQLGRLLDRLEGSGQLDSTLVAVSSDHGEELLDRQRYPFHNASTYESTLRIPLAMRLPGAVPQGARYPQLAASLDIAPTLLALLGLDAPDSFQGRSLAPLMRGESWQERPVFSELEDKIVSVRTPLWRLVHNPGEHHPPLVPNGHIQRAGLVIDDVHNALDIGVVELYDLTQDPLEQRNLAGSAPATVVPLQQLIDAFADLYGWRLDGAVPPQPLDPELRARLEAMGYVLP